MIATARPDADGFIDDVLAERGVARCVTGLELGSASIRLVWHERTHRDTACRYLRRVIREVSQQLFEVSDGP